MGKDVEAAEEKPAEKGISPKIVYGLVGFCCLCMIGSIVAVFLMLKNHQPAQSAEITAEAHEGEEASEGHSKAVAQYVSIKPHFVVSFVVHGKTRYLQVGVDIMSRDEAIVKLIEANAPKIKNDLLTLFKQQKFTDLQSHGGIEALRQASLEAVRSIVAAESGSQESVEDVLFTSFVTQ